MIIQFLVEIILTAILGIIAGYFLFKIKSRYESKSIKDNAASRIFETIENKQYEFLIDGKNLDLKELVKPYIKQKKEKRSFLKFIKDIFKRKEKQPQNHKEILNIKKEIKKPRK